MKVLALLSFTAALSVASAGPQPQQRLQSNRLSLEEAFGIAVARLDPCEKAIWSCCQSDRGTFSVPSDCFAANGCYGLHWIGHRACSPNMVNAVGLQIQSGMSEALAGGVQSRFGFGGGPFFP